MARLVIARPIELPWNPDFPDWLTVASPTEPAGPPVLRVRPEPDESLKWQSERTKSGLSRANVSVSGELLWGRLEQGARRGYLVDLTDAVTASDVVRCEPRGEPDRVVVVTFSDAGRKKLAALTEKSKGGLLVIGWGGIVESTPRVESAITGGEISIAIRDPAADVGAIARGIMGSP